MFAAEEVTVEVGFDVAAPRLIRLVHGDALHDPSEAAYEEGLAVVLRVGPFGAVRGLSKLVRVRSLEPIDRGSSLSVPLRWEATGAAGELFPVLDADLTLSGEGAARVRLRLAGSYRPPFGLAGMALDRVLMHRVTTATLRSLLQQVAGDLADPAAVPSPRTGTAPLPRPAWQEF